MKHPKFARSFEVQLDLPAELRGLEELAYNFRWAWDADTRRLFRMANPYLWEEVEHNPVALLHGLSAETLGGLAADKTFRALLKERRAALEAYLSAETWFQREHGDKAEKTLVAYFCAEFGITEALPIYSGGLGVLAGDHLKAASDLGIPLVGIGLLYAKGYFRQFMGPDGWQQEEYPRYDYYRFPIRPVTGEDGQPLRVSVEFPERQVSCQIWKAVVGRVSLYLLDSNLPENRPDDRQITDHLYGGDEDTRIRQELILGQGGVKALKALGLNPTVCHMNEGHAAFMTVERIRTICEAEGVGFRLTRQAVVNGNVFTTHTPVAAGFDRFTQSHVKLYLEPTLKDLGVEYAKIEGFGRINPANADEPFNMAVFAMKNSNYLNGVSKLHAKVSRSMFANLWLGFAEDEVPIDAITNGVHTLSWVSRDMAELLDRYLKDGWRREPDRAENWAGLDKVPAQELWEVRQKMRAQLVQFVRRMLRQRDEREGFRGDPHRYDDVLDPNALTIGFARRFATYKRATLILRDRDRLKRLIEHPQRPVQLILAGKSHPRDDEGKRLIQEIHEFVAREGLERRIVFLEDHDIYVARALVQGVDVWLNNPRRPMEASGTSGMKILPNGGLNCSVLDGWWDEAYTEGVGWAIGGRRTVDDAGRQDWLDSLMLYRLLEEEIAPCFYRRRAGLPGDWMNRVKASMKSLAPQFSTHRMVKEYTERFYLPASTAFQNLVADGFDGAKKAVDWRDKVNDKWEGVKVVEVSEEVDGPLAVGKEFRIVASVDLGGLTPDDVRAEALVGRAGSEQELHDWAPVELVANGKSKGLTKFEGPATAGAAGQLAYVVRVVPKNESLRVETELKLVRWQ